MEWQIIVALLIAIPVILLPVVFVWYLNIGPLYSAIKRAISRRVVHRKEARELVKVSRVE